MEWVVKNTNTQFSAINTRLDKMDSRLDKMDSRFDEIMDLLKKDKGKEVVVRDSSPSTPNFPSQNQSNRDPRRSPSNFQSTYSPSRTQRQGTHDIQPSNTPTRNREIRIKREDIGLFDPHHDDKGIIVDGKNLIFTDIFAFGERIDSFLEEPDTKQDNERQIVSMFQTLLAGSALLWWNNELNYTTRTQIRIEGLNSIMEKLQTRFLPDAAQASDKFTSAKLSLRDIAQDESALVLFIQKKPKRKKKKKKKKKFVELAIRYHTYENPDENWVDLIPALQWNLNNAHSRVINTNPHEYLFGFKIAGPLDRLTGVSKKATDVRFMRKTIESVIVEGNNIFFLSRHLL
jgi:hypothetical protein